MAETAVESLALPGNGSHVMEKALIYCSPERRRTLALELLQATSDECMGVECLARTPSGGFVVKALLNLGGDIEEEVRRQLTDLRKSFQDLQARRSQKKEL